MKDEYGIEPAAGGAVMVAGAASGGAGAADGAAGEDEKTEFNVILKGLEKLVKWELERSSLSVKPLHKNQVSIYFREI